MIHLPEKVKEIRQKLNLTQTEAAARAGIARRTYQLVERGANAEEKTLSAIASAFGVEVDEFIYDPLDKDSFTDWPWSLSKFVKRIVEPPAHAFCRSEDDAAKAIQIMRDNWVEHLARTEDLSREGVYYNSNRRLETDFSSFESRYREIWKVNQHAIFYATTNGVRSGVSAVLPVTDTAFENLKSGKINYMEIGPADVLLESQNLILDSCCEIPCSEPVSWYQITESLSFATFFHIALMGLNPVGSDFRMLGFAASPTNLKRLCGAGFTPLGVTMPRYQYELCEFSITHDGSDDTLKRSLTSAHYLKLFKMFSIQESARRAKVRMVRRVLQVLKKAADSNTNVGGRTSVVRQVS